MSRIIAIADTPLAGVLGGYCEGVRITTQAEADELEER